jgi:hypothetical protein
MAGCLNLRRMAMACSEGVTYRAAASPHLCSLAHWARPRSAASATTFLPQPISAAQAHGIELPSDEVLVREFEALGRALQAASAQSLYGDRWRGASSSTVLMRDVFSQPKFYECCPCYLYLLQHCALKGVPEAIVEGMGGVWDRCAAPGRHLSFEAGVMLECAAALRRGLWGLLGQSAVSPLQGRYAALHACRRSSGPAEQGGPEAAAHSAQAPCLTVVGSLNQP